MIKNIYSKIKVFIFYNFLNKKLKLPRNWYIETDEKFKFTHVLEAVNYVKVAELPNVFFEFGCHSGRTYSAALLASKFLNFELENYAFDSFEGLPKTSKEEDGYFRSGTFNTKKEDFVKIVKNRTGILLQDDQLVEGYYDKSLNNKLKERLPKSVGFVHIDVDLYSSTITVLEFIKTFLVSGTVILFDDWYCFPPGKEMGERKALNEFLRKYPEIELEEWKNYSTFGKSFLVKKV